MSTPPRTSALKESAVVAFLALRPIFFWPAAGAGWVIGLGSLVWDNGLTGYELDERRTTGWIMLAIGIAATAALRLGKTYVDRHKAEIQALRKARAEPAVPKQDSIRQAPGQRDAVAEVDAVSPTADARRLFEYAPDEPISKADLVERYSRIRAATPDYFRGHVDQAFADLMRTAGDPT